MIGSRRNSSFDRSPDHLSLESTWPCLRVLEEFAGSCVANAPFPIDKWKLAHRSYLKVTRRKQNDRS